MKHILITTIAAVVLVGCGPSVDIHEAARTGNIEAVKQHIAAGTDLNAKDRLGMTPLRWAARKGHLEIMELLIAKGADLHGKGLLHTAAILGQEKAAELLIAKGVNVNAKHGGVTPLHVAAEEGCDINNDYKSYKQVVELLISKGADVNAKATYDGCTPLDYSTNITYSNWKERQVAQKEITSLLRKHGGNYTLINFAVAAGDIEAVKKFLAVGADVNWVPGSPPFRFNMHIYSPLDLAKKLKHTEIEELLRKHGGKTRKELRAEGK